MITRSNLFPKNNGNQIWQLELACCDVMVLLSDNVECSLCHVCKSLFLVQNLYVFKGVEGKSSFLFFYNLWFYYNKNSYSLHKTYIKMM